MTRVAVGTITTEEMLRFKSQRVVDGTVRDVDLRDCECWKRN